MKIIVGLGNPGKRFEKTRHNVGFRAIDKIAKNFQFPIFKFKSKLKAEISEGKINKEKIVLAKPQTFMNNSGRAVKSLITNYGLRIDDLFVIHDDLDLPLGKIKIVKNRGSAGHKGVQSIIDELKTKDFVRFRIGIKPKGSEQRAIKKEKFVLQKFNKKEGRILKDAIKRTIKALETVLKKGVEKAMSEFNY